MFLTCKILNKTKFHSNKEALKIVLIHFFGLFDTDLLLIWMNNFGHGFRFRSASYPVLHILLIISRGECSKFSNSYSVTCCIKRIVAKHCILAFEIKNKLLTFQKNYYHYIC